MNSGATNVFAVIGESETGRTDGATARALPDAGKRVRRVIETIDGFHAGLTEFEDDVNERLGETTGGSNGLGKFNKPRLLNCPNVPNVVRLSLFR